MHRLVLFSAVCLMAAPAVAAPNLVVNGGFEAGNTGFTSDYSYVAVPGEMAMYPEGTYTVGETPRAYHNLWADFGAFEGDLFFIANGNTDDNVAAWEQTLTGLIIGKTYTFSAYATNVCCNGDFGGGNSSPFLVAVKTNGGTSTIATTGAVAGTGVWQQFTGSFVATATTVGLGIFDDNSVASGNDYGLDAITVSAVPEPASWAMMIAGFGLVGAAVRGRQAAKTVLA